MDFVADFLTKLVLFVMAMLAIVIAAAPIVYWLSMKYPNDNNPDPVQRAQLRQAGYEEHEYPSHLQYKKEKRANDN